MPYAVQKRKNQFCVVNQNTEKPIPGGCHPTRESALRHMRALYVNVEDASKEQIMIERKSYPLTVKTADEKGVIEAIVSVFSNVDSGNEKVMPGFFSKSIDKKLPKGVWAHDWKQPIAKTIEAKELLPGDPMLPDGLKELGGAYIKGQFNLDTQRGREAYSDIKFGIVDEFSIGYKVLKDQKDDKTGARELLEGDWKEWSPVLVGMNDQTRLLSVKSEDGKSEEDKGMLEDAIQEAENSMMFLCDKLMTAWYRLQMLSDADPSFDVAGAIDGITADLNVRMNAMSTGDSMDSGMGMMASSDSFSFKGDLRDRLPFAKHAEAARGAVEVFAQQSVALAELVNEITERSKAIMERRETKAGAVYSQSNLSHMQRIHDSMTTVKKTVNAMHNDMAALISKAKKTEKTDDEMDVKLLRTQSLRAQSLALAALS